MSSSTAPPIGVQVAREHTPGSSALRDVPWQIDVSRYWIIGSGLLFVTYLGTVLLTFQHYGITFDEEWQHDYGKYILEWYRSGFQDDRAIHYWNLVYTGGLAHFLVQLAATVSPLGEFETGHLVGAVFGLVGVVGAWKLGNLLGGPPAGFLAALFLILTPRFYGHSFHNLVDIPLATLYLFSLYYLVRVVGMLPRPPLPLLLKLGVAIGLALGVRVAGGALLVAYVGLFFCLWFLSTYSRQLATPWTWPTLRPSMTRLARAFLTASVVAYAIMLLCWPAAQANPILQPIRALRFANNFEYTFSLFFDGQMISSADLPWYFSLKWFSVTLPDFYFVAGLAALLVLPGVLRLGWKEMARPSSYRALGTMILVLSVVVPLAYGAVTTPVDYDEVRHFLFVVPPLAVLASLAVTRLMTQPRVKSLRTIVAVLLVGLMGTVVFDMANLHPYEYVYFNRMFGHGLANASRSFETDYWGSSYKEGVEWLVTSAPQGDSASPLKVASCGYSLSTSYFLHDDRFRYVGSYTKGDPVSDVPNILLATTRWNCHQKLDGVVLHTVSRMNTPLLYIIAVNS